MRKGASYKCGLGHHEHPPAQAKSGTRPVEVNVQGPCAPTPAYCQHLLYYVRVSEKNPLQSNCALGGFVVY